jgi:hypothetical protein
MYSLWVLDAHLCLSSILREEPKSNLLAMSWATALLFCLLQITIKNQSPFVLVGYGSVLACMTSSL